MISDKGSYVITWRADLLVAYGRIECPDGIVRSNLFFKQEETYAQYFDITKIDGISIFPNDLVYYKNESLNNVLPNFSEKRPPKILLPTNSQLNNKNINIPKNRICTCYLAALFSLLPLNNTNFEYEYNPGIYVAYFIGDDPSLETAHYTSEFLVGVSFRRTIASEVGRVVDPFDASNIRREKIHDSLLMSYQNLQTTLSKAVAPKGYVRSEIVNLGAEAFSKKTNPPIHRLMSFPSADDSAIIGENEFSQIGLTDTEILGTEFGDDVSR